MTIIERTSRLECERMKQLRNNLAVKEGHAQITLGLTLEAFLLDAYPFICSVPYAPVMEEKNIRRPPLFHP